MFREAQIRKKRRGKKKSGEGGRFLEALVKIIGQFRKTE